MIARVLPPEEYGRIQVPEFSAPLLDYFRPEDVQIVVVEDDGEIVACMHLIRVVHLEGLWIAPERRGSPLVLKTLLRGTAETGMEWSNGLVMAQVDQDRVADLVTRAGGVRIPVDSYMMRLN